MVSELRTFRVTPPDLIMRYVAAALLCAMGENEISAANMEKILSSVGVEADKERLNQVEERHKLMPLEICQKYSATRLWPPARASPLRS